MNIFVLKALVSLLLYPGLLLVLVLGFCFAFLTWGKPALRSSVAAATWRSVEGVCYGTGIVLAGVGSALMPWPLNSIAAGSGGWLWAWAAFEGAFLLPLLPALLAGSPLVVRAASREAQIGVIGRALLWLALGTALLLPPGLSLTLLPAYLLAALAALFAFPAAISQGPFAPETSLVVGGAAHGLDRDSMALAEAARHVRTAALLAASLVALLPYTLLPAWLELLLLAALFGAVSVLIRRYGALFPRMPLPDALRLCWLRALPLGLAALIYLGLI